MSKCKNCGRQKLDHKARDLACPFGRKHRVVGHINYHTNQFFSEKEKTVSKKKKSKVKKKKKDKLFGSVHWNDGTSRVAVCSPYGDAEWDITTDKEKVTCGSCLRILRSRFPEWFESRFSN
jgi:hypothetical protein